MGADDKAVTDILLPMDKKKRGKKTIDEAMVADTAHWLSSGLLSLLEDE
ncbi:MAG TPA: hypothetical protein K8V12_09470 [Psychrobacter pasteurii]|nr:hypothetical protein [Psychrobacter pasteurii]